MMPQMLDSFCSNVKKDVDADGSGGVREFPECIDNVLGNSENVFDGGYINSKVEQVVNFIKERKGNGRSKLVFSHFHDEIDLIKKKLEEDGMCVATFDGRVPADKRRLILTDNSVDVLILQIAAGCEGLNLQRFSEIYFPSTSWNPAVEDQAVARCFRIGQTSQVDVFRFITHDTSVVQVPTIEEHMSEVQDDKRMAMEALYRGEIAV